VVVALSWVKQRRLFSSLRARAAVSFRALFIRVTLIGCKRPKVVLTLFLVEADVEMEQRCSRVALWN
jgi:hypothetical protein